MVTWNAKVCLFVAVGWDQHLDLEYRTITRIPAKDELMMVNGKAYYVISHWFNYGRQVYIDVKEAKGVDTAPIWPDAWR